jgi:hypothetical protein
MDLRDGTRHVHLDLSAMESTKKLRGWCRGIEKVGHRLFVGMTMLRASRHREALRHLFRGEAGRKLPTRVLEIDLETETIVDSYPVGNEAGGTLYGIHALTPDSETISRAECSRDAPERHNEPSTVDFSIQPAISP